MKTLLSTLCALIILTVNPVYASDSLTETARGLLRNFTNAVVAGPDTLAPILAPEYQIMRANGTGFKREGYLQNGVKTVSIMPGFSYEDIHASQADGVLVVRYYLVIDEKVDGIQAQRRAPRLTVFRQIEGDWKVVSHANFAAK